MTELIAGLCTFAPALVVEDLRSLLQKRYYGDFDKAFADLDVEKQGFLESHVFMQRAKARFGMSDLEARKLITEVDVYEYGKITKADFLSALAVAEPSLFFEDLRKKVLRRFRSIQAALTKAADDSEK